MWEALRGWKFRLLPESREGHLIWTWPWQLTCLAEDVTLRLRAGEGGDISQVKRGGSAFSRVQRHMQSSGSQSELPLRILLCFGGCCYKQQGISMEGDHENSNIAYLLNKELIHIWGYVSSLSDAITWEKKRKGNGKSSQRNLKPKGKFITF